ncbi:MAG: hypothetical protein AAFQ82_17290, partial [Myxococcota bacterium]
LDFDDLGHLSRVQLLGTDASIAGAFGTVYAKQGRASALFEHGRLARVASPQGTVALDLNSGLAMDMERASAQLTYDGQSPTLTVESGRGLIYAEFGRLTLPEGFEIRADRCEEKTTLSGFTPNAKMDSTPDVLAVNDFSLSAEFDDYGFRCLELNGTTHIDHPQRSIQLTSGLLSVRRKRQTLVYSGDTSSLGLKVGGLSIDGKHGSKQLRWGERLTGTIESQSFSFVAVGDELRELSFSDASLTLGVTDPADEVRRTLTLPRSTELKLSYRDSEDVQFLLLLEQESAVIALDETTLSFESIQAIELVFDSEGALTTAAAVRPGLSPIRVPFALVRGVLRCDGL